VETLLNDLPQIADIPGVVSRLSALLADKDEVRLLSHQVDFSYLTFISFHNAALLHFVIQIIIKLCTIAPTILSAAVDTFIEPLTKTIAKKAASKDALDAERAQELVRSAGKVIQAISALPDIESNVAWQDFLSRMKRANINFTD